MSSHYCLYRTQLETQYENRDENQCKKTERRGIRDDISNGSKGEMLRSSQNIDKVEGERDEVSGD